MTDLTLKNFSVGYGKKEIIKDVSAQFKGGEMTAVIGRNGTGKTTLLKCINHILKPTGGKVFINNKDNALLSSYERAKTIGYVP